MSSRAGIKLFKLYRGYILSSCCGSLLIFKPKRSFLACVYYLRPVLEALRIDSLYAEKTHRKVGRGVFIRVLHVYTVKYTHLQGRMGLERFNPLK
jgi:hypothetical protein